MGSETFDGLDNFHSFDNSSEDDVLVVEPFGLDGAQEELRSIGVGSSVGLISQKLNKKNKLKITMDRTPGPVCFSLKFSSGNFSP